MTHCPNFFKLKKSFLCPSSPSCINNSRFNITTKTKKKGGQQHGWMPCHRLSITKIGLPIVFPRDIDILGWCSADSVLTSWAEGASLALVGHPSGDGATIKIPYERDALLHRPTLHPIFSTGLIQTDSESLNQMRLT